MKRNAHKWTPGERIITKWGPGTLDTDQTPRLWGTDSAWVTLDTGDRISVTLYNCQPEPEPENNTELRQLSAEPEPAPPTVRTPDGNQIIMADLLAQAPAARGMQLSMF